LKHLLSHLLQVDVLSDRVAFALQMTGAAPIHGYQIPSFTDISMCAKIDCANPFSETHTLHRRFMNGSAGFPLFDPQGNSTIRNLTPR
jgi:hypothetical protein